MMRKGTYLKSRLDGAIQQTSGVLGIEDEEGNYTPYDDGDLYEISKDDFESIKASIPKPEKNTRLSIHERLEIVEYELDLLKGV